MNGIVYTAWFTALNFHMKNAVCTTYLVHFHRFSSSVISHSKPIYTLLYASLG